MDTPLALCVGRDIKGLYAKQRAGTLFGLTGADDPYEPPEQPEIRIATADRTVTDSAGDVLAALIQRNLI